MLTVILIVRALAFPKYPRPERRITLSVTTVTSYTLANPRGRVAVELKSPTRRSWVQVWVAIPYFDTCGVL